MATTIYFNGRVTSIPGSYSEVDASGLAAVGLGATGIVACIGEAEGGFPYSAAAAEDDYNGYYRISNPGKVGRTFREGDLKEAGNILFDPSKDPGIPSGAQEVVFVKVNPSTDSTRAVVDVDADPSGTFSSVDYGLFTTQISVDIEDGTNGGKKVTVTAAYDGEIEEFDDLGADGWFSLVYRTIAGATITASLDPDAAFTGAFALDSGLVSPVSPYSVPCIGVNDLWTLDFTGPATITIESSSVADTLNSVTLYGIDNGTGLPATEIIIFTGTTPAASSTTWSELHGIAKTVTTGTATFKEGAATLITMAPATLIFGAGIEASTVDSDIEVKGTVTVVAAAAAVTKVLLVGYAGGVPALEEITLNGTTPVVSTTDDWDYLTHVFTSDLLAGTVITVSGLFWNEGEAARVSSDDAADTMDIILFGIDDSSTTAQETVTLNGVTPVTSTTLWNTLYGWKLADADGTAPAGAVSLMGTAAGLTVSGGGATYVTQTSTATDTEEGVVSLEMHVGGGQAGGGSTLAWDTTGLTASDSGTVTFYGEDAAGAFLTESVAAASSGVTTGVFTKLEAIAYDGDVTGSTSAVLFSAQIFSLAVGTYTTIQQVADFFDAFEGITFTTITTSPALVGLSDMDEQLLSDITSAATFYGVNYEMQATISAESNYVDYTVNAAGTKPPANLTGAFLTGGTEGVTTFADWQAALDLIRDLRINTIVPLTSDSAVHAAAVSHCAYMGGAGRSERDCILGAASGETFSALKTRAKELNTRHARMCIQDVVRFNTSGVREQFPPYLGTACVAAGMQAGSEVGTSLTWKYLNVLDVVGNDSSYTITDDAHEIIQSGLVGIESVPNIGYRWLRNVTTYLIDDNIAYVEGSVNEAVNFAVFEFRTAMEAMVGQKGFDGSVSAALGIGVAVLGALAAPGVRAITQHRNLAITLESDVMTVDVEIAPIVPINFVKNTIHLVSASFAAAA